MAELENILQMRLHVNGSITDVTGNGNIYRNSLLVNRLRVLWTGNISDTVSVTFSQNGEQVTNPRALIYEEVTEAGEVAFSLTIPKEVMALVGAVSLSLSVRNSANKLLTSGIISVAVNNSAVPSDQDVPSSSEELQTQINVLKDDVDNITADTDEALMKADEALTKSGEAVTTANEAKTIAEGIDGKATEALATSRTSLANSEEAVATAKDAKGIALGIEGKADSAIATANQASSDVIRLEGEIVTFESNVNEDVSQFKMDVNADITQFKTDTNTEIERFEGYVNGEISDLEQQIIEKQGTKVTEGGLFVSTFNADTKADLTRVIADENALMNLAGTGRTTETVKGNADGIASLAGAGRTTETIKDNADDIASLRAIKSDKVQVRLLNATHIKSGVVHTFTLNADSEFLSGQTEYSIRAVLTANFIDGDIITLTDGTTSYSRIRPLTADGYAYELSIILEKPPLVIFDVNLGGSERHAFFRGGDGILVRYEKAGNFVVIKGDEVEPLSKARYQLAATSNGKHMLFGGGRDDGSVYDPNSSAVDSYDETLTRQTATPLSKAREELAATSNGKYMLFGGGRPYNDSSSVVDAYDETLTRQTATPLSKARGRLAATSNGKNMLFGGGSYNDSSSVVDAYDETLTRQTATPLSQARYQLAATSNGKYMLFGGGSMPTNSGSTLYYAIVDAYDETLTRQTATPLSQARGRLAATSNGKNMLFGGGSYAANSSAVDSYDETLTRQTATPLSKARGQLAATSNGMNILFGGGYGGGYVAAVDLYIPMIRLAIHQILEELSNTQPYKYSFTNGVKGEATADITLESPDAFTGTVKYNPKLLITN